jgi:phage-related protein (TIGR01555 family)
MAGWLDSFVNLLSGLGVSGRDKAAAQQYANTLLTQPQLELAYRGDWIARKVVDIPANDSTRAWRSWEADEGDIEALEDAEKGLKLQNKLQYAMKRARLYGGAAMILGVDVGKPEEELNVELVTTDSLKFVHVATRYELTAGEVERDLMSPWFGQPKYYERNMGVVSAPYVRIHPSRVIRFVGSEYPDPWQAPDAWGDSVLQTVDDAIKAAGIVTGSIATLISEAKVDVIKTPGLTEALSTVEGTDRLTKRFSYANTSKSIVNALILDSEEEWQRMNATFTGMPDVLQMYLLIASGAADIPATRMLGQSPAGMNATGESDIRNYYDRIKSDQVTQLQPSLAMLDEVLIRSALGTRDPSIHYSWNSLWQLDNVAKAELENKRASTYKIDVDAGLIPIDIMRKARENQLMEDGTYPGLELIIEEYERDVGEQGDAPDQQHLSLRHLSLLSAQEASRSLVKKHYPLRLQSLWARLLLKPRPKHRRRTHGARAKRTRWSMTPSPGHCMSDEMSSIQRTSLIGRGRKASRACCPALSFTLRSPTLALRWIGRRLYMRPGTRTRMGSCTCLLVAFACSRSLARARLSLSSRHRALRIATAQSRS